MKYDYLYFQLNLRKKQTGADMLKAKRYMDRWLIIKLLIMCGFVISCSDNNQQQYEKNLQNEFTKTYIFVTQKHAELEDLSIQFESMKRINSGAFSSIAYQWHQIATSNCRSSEIQIALPSKSNYEKLLTAKPSAEQFVKIINDEERKCLAEVYLTHWDKINRMIIFNYPNI